MNYVLQIIRGRSEANTLKLIDGVNSIGRHDDCLIRIRSAQVSRRHCELYEDGDKLMLRDLGSSNGTFVNGKRVLGQQSLKAGDVLTIGGVTLRVDAIKLATKPDAQLAPASKPSDTAELDALPVAEDDVELEEFEIAMDDEPEHIDIVPLDDEPAPTPPKKAAKPASPTPAPSAAADKSTSTDENKKAAERNEPPSSEPEEDDVVAQFLMDLKLDEDD
jgi:predicted component of type VI protein secretion system